MAGAVSGGRVPREALLARTLVELADTLVADFDVVELLTLVADRCVELLEVGAAGLMLAGPDGDLRVMASSSEAMRVLELFELQSQEGPCLDCYRSGRPVTDEDLAKVTSRWPLFAAETLAAGFCSVLALPLRWQGTVIGALNLFRIEPGEMLGARYRSGPGLGRCGHHRHPAAPGLARGPGPEPTAPARPQQPRSHRTSQGDGGSKTRPQHGASVLRSAHTRPQPQSTPGRRG